MSNATYTIFFIKIEFTNFYYTVLILVQYILISIYHLPLAIYHFDSFEIVGENMCIY